jgi:hypothetical protein
VSEECYLNVTSSKKSETYLRMIGYLKHFENAFNIIITLRF